jgi:hypothetical protein
VRGDGLVGYVATRFVGAVDGEPRALAMVQTWDGMRIVPAARHVLIDRDAMVERARRRLEVVRQGDLAGSIATARKSSWSALARLQAGDG